MHSATVLVKSECGNIGSLSKILNFTADSSESGMSVSIGDVTVNLEIITALVLGALNGEVLWTDGPPLYACRLLRSPYLSSFWCFL